MSLLAQSESAVGLENNFLANPGDNSVVRNWKNGYTLSSHAANGFTHFVKTDYGLINATSGSTAYYSALIADSISDIIVSDMRIVDDYAFFCGSIWDSIAPQTYIQHGILGCFDIQEMYATNTLAIKLHVYDSIREFGRMVAYKDTTDYKVVALGTYREYDTSYSVYRYPSCLVEDYIMTSVSSITIRKIQPFNVSGTQREEMMDLVLSGEYVVLVGRLYFPNPPINSNYSICIRLANKDDVINDPMLDNHYVYNTVDQEVNNIIRAVALNENHIAISYVYPYTPEDFFTRLRVIEIPSMTMIASQQFKTYTKDEPIELAYDPRNDILTLLHTMPFQTLFSYNNSYFVQIKPHSKVPYSAPVLFPQKGLYSSLDMFNSEYYVATGQNFWYYQHTSAPQPNINLCPKTNEINIDPIHTLNTIVSPMPNINITTYYHHNTKYSIVKPTIINLLCDDK